MEWENTELDSTFRNLFFVKFGILFDKKKTVLLLGFTMYANILLGIIYSYAESDPGWRENLASNIVNYFWIPLYYYMALIGQFFVLGSIKFLTETKFSKLFKSDTDKEKFINLYMNKINSSKEKILIFAASLVYISIMVIPSTLSQEFMIDDRNLFDSPYLVAALVLVHINSLMWVTSLASAVYLLVVILNLLNDLGKEKSISSLKQIKNNNSDGQDEIFEKDVDNEKSISYEEYHDSMRVIGIFLFDAAVKLIIFSIIYSIITFFAVEYGDWNNIALVVPIILGIIAIIFSLIPQVSIHQTLKVGKTVNIEELKQKRFLIKNNLNKLLKHPNDVRNFDFEAIQKQIQTKDYLQDEISEIQHLGTWSYDFPEVLKLLAGVLSSGIPFILSFGDNIIY